MSNSRSIRIPGRFVDWLAGTDAWQTGRDDPDAVAMVEAVKSGRTMACGRGYAVEATMDSALLAVLREYAGYLLDAIGGGDDSPSERRAALTVLDRLAHR